MGNSLTQQELTLSESLQQQYFFQTNQFLYHKATRRPCTLHRIQTFSKQQSSAAERNITLYKTAKCNSISKLNEHFLLDNSGYCSDQQKFYLVFDGHNSPNIKEEYFSRRYAGQGFTHQQIEQILSCMLCGLRHYKQFFHRKDSHLSLESICINRNQNNKLWFKDPWLVQKQNDNHQLPINFLASYPSPQKIQASNQANYDYDQLRSDLFSIGIFGLQFFNMNFRDDLYVHKKFVDRLKLGETLNTIQNGRLRGGLGILLSEDPNERCKIYQYWDIACNKSYQIGKVTLPPVHSPGHPQISVLHTTGAEERPLQTPYSLHSGQGVQPYYNPQNQVSSVSNVGSHLHISNYNNSNANSQSYYWQPQLSNALKSSQIKINPSSSPNDSQLSKQFTKQIQIKKTIHQPDRNQVNNFKKTPNNVYFQSSTKDDKQPQPSQPPLAYKAPSISMSIKPHQQVDQNPLYQSFKNSSNVSQSFETPKFNYFQSPNSSVDMKNSVTNFQIQGSIPTANTVPSQSNFNKFTQFSSNQSPTKSISSSPILTKSIINPQPMLGPYLQPKLSGEQNTQAFSSNPSLRETKFNSQGERNSASFGSLPLPIPPSFISREEPKPQAIKLPITVSIESNNYENNSINTSQPHPKSYLENLANLQSSPQSLNQENVPKSPSTVQQVTPPPPSRNPNKYNSTIVEVNEETPHQSEQSDNENNDIQFIVEEYETGSKYEGFKKNGLRHGRGKFFYQDGGYYDGEWRKNQMHGWGKLYYEGGQLAYQGNWAHDEFHGYGKVYNDNPVVLQGGFDYTNFDLLDDYWEFYEGMLANDTKEGRGRIQLTNREVFEGDFHVDRIQGFGKFLRRDGNIVEGIWRDSRLIKILNTNDIHR